MGIKMMKMKIGNKMCDVTSPEEYYQHPDFYDSNYTALKLESEHIVLPIINKSDYQAGVPGIYPESLISRYNIPENREEYDMDSIIDFTNVTEYKDVIEKSSMVKSLENKILENSDNITKIKHDENDEPEMTALKEAINSKECDINAYGPRFDGNFANDRRILSDKSITMTKLKKYGNAMDMKITLTIEDKNDKVPNPIGKVISVELTGGGPDE